jgi:glycosyltransferase involved in cell wall biosynthesis
LPLENRIEAIGTLNWQQQRRSIDDLKNSTARILCSHITSDRVEIIPNGFQLPDTALPRVMAEPARLGFIGNFDWSANAEGVTWFTAEVWPLIRQKLPQDTSNEFASWTAMVVPILVGAGARIKIAEAFAPKCPVVSTSLGAYGYEVRDKEHLLIADTAHDFAQACLRLMACPEQGLQMSALAHELFLKRWTWDSYQNRVHGLCSGRSLPPISRSL